MRRSALRPLRAGLVATLWIVSIPGLTPAQSAGAPGSSLGGIQGTVKDGSGSAVAGAIVTLETAASAGQRTAITDQAGSFRFSAVKSGEYKIAIVALGFAVWTAPNLVVGSGEDQPPLSVVLQVAPSSSTLNVTLSPHDLAAEQLKAEEKQRLLGLFPQYFISYAPDAVPLSAAQKFHLGWKTIIDPVTLLGVGLSAGIQQWRNNYPEFGQGSEGYAKRFGAQYADRVSGVIIGHVVMQSIFHQDPRYFYKGTGSIRSRAMYAIGTAFVVKGDNGHWQPDYSDVLGGLAASEISTLYYPASSRPGRRLVDSVLLGFGGRAANHLLHEFVLGKVTTHVPKVAPGLSPRSLREGTPVSLISVEDWSSKPAENGGLIAFMLASDIKVDGLIVAAIGSKAWGQASFVGARVGDSTAMHVGLERVHLKVGNTDVPLRSTLLQDGGGALEYHRLENSGRIAITLYVAENVMLSPAR